MINYALIFTKIMTGAVIKSGWRFDRDGGFILVKCVGLCSRRLGHLPKSIRLQMCTLIYSLGNLDKCWLPLSNP